MLLQEACQVGLEGSVDKEANKNWLKKHESNEDALPLPDSVSDYVIMSSALLS